MQHNTPIQESSNEFRRRVLMHDQVQVTYKIDEPHEGMRADQFLKKQYKSKSRNEIQKAIDSGSITIKGKRLKASTVVHIGDEIQVITKKDDFEPQVDLNYKILFEDDYFIVINKPGNLPVHPAGRFVFNTLVMALRKDHSDWVTPHLKGEENEKDFFLIHRLDRETSGVIILAKTKEMARFMINEFFDRKTIKKYFAIAKGEIQENEFIVDADIGPARGVVRLQMHTYPKGTYLTDPEIADAATKFTVLKRKNGYTLLDCELFTGRQHQIRVHLKHIGHPVVGDKLYGGREDLFLQFAEEGIFTDEMKQAFTIERHALHSRYLKFFHPIRNEFIEIEAELPHDLKEIFN